MPKQVVFKETIVEAAMRMTRAKGFQSVNARSVAKEMGCSVQPIYSYFKNMEELKSELYEKAMKNYNGFIYSRTDASNYLQSMAKANIDFAKEETNLFRFLFLTKMDGIDSFGAIYKKMGDKKITKELSKNFNVMESKTEELYTMMIIFTHGIATMLATSEIQIADGEITEVLKKAYDAFIKH